MWLGSACHLHRSWKAERRPRPCFPTSASAPCRAMFPPLSALATVQGPGGLWEIEWQDGHPFFWHGRQRAPRGLQLPAETAASWSQHYTAVAGFLLSRWWFGAGDTAPLASMTTEEYPKSRSGVFLQPSQWFWKPFNTLQKSFSA